ncbi:HET-domain-containing protein, partial [Trametes versicolor FP-101664 SS1]|uniref:HET-domain-containing protein n=1 Tax=Trametes versicolor (strain FP-101664) TaxID=717944 RepID=UPI00046246BD
KFSKLMGFIQAAVAGGYQFVWADMCCIDSTNSDEVTAATASMYSWYSSADVCYAYLRDVPTPYHEEDALPPGPPTEFSQSVWFTRAWTLQELLAPKSVLFFSTDWKVIGTKQGLSEIIEDITGIDVEVLTGKRQVQEMCMPCRMSWAEKRTASKPEDRAYALMG